MYVYAMRLRFRHRDIDLPFYATRLNDLQLGEYVVGSPLINKCLLYRSKPTS